MSTGPALHDRSAPRHDEERPRPSPELDPRAMLHSRVSDCSVPEVVKHEEDDVPLRLPLNTVIVKNHFDLARFSPLEPERVKESEEEEEEEEEGEGGGGEPSCSLDLTSQTKARVLSLFDTDDSDDGERTRRRDGRAAQTETFTGVQPVASDQDIYRLIFHNRVFQDKTPEPKNNREQSEDKPKPGISSIGVAETKTNGPDPPQMKPPAKERKRAPATFNGAVDKTRHRCGECLKYFQCEAHLQRHMLIHYGLKPFECPVCDKAFRYKSSYKAHLNMHTEDKPLTCALCCKGFTQSRDLKRHMLSHTDEKNFDCPECGGKFKHKHNLIRHISVIHKAEKPYPCPMCDKAFAQKHDFMTHMRTHSGEKPFSCGVCSRSFGAKGTLRTHMKVHRKRVPKELQGALSFHDFMSDEKDVCD